MSSAIFIKAGVSLGSRRGSSMARNSEFTIMTEMEHVSKMLCMTTICAKRLM